MDKKYVSWRRVSTQKQGNSGLGLEAQKEIIRFFIERAEGEWIADYEECYTGTELNECIELKRAIEHAKREGAVLIIAKSDRFRNTIEALRVYEEMGDGNIMFCDLPHTDKFTLTLFFALAEREALLVSIRTKQALAAKKARGDKLGGQCERWIAAYRRKTREQLLLENSKRGRKKNERYLQKRETQVFLKVIKLVFENYCVGDDPSEWDWSKINTKGDGKKKMLSLMKGYKELDETGSLFSNWDFDQDETKLQVKLSTLIKNVRNSIRTYYVKQK